jgi:hypothetical protein
MALPSLRTWKSLADFKYPESSVQLKYQTLVELLQACWQYITP